MAPLRLLVVCLLLAACGPRPGIVLLPEAETVGVNRTVFVATSRAPEPDGSFGSARSTDLSYLSYDVSVPPRHAIGRIEYPNSQADPARHFVASAYTPHTSIAAFQRSLRQALAARAPADREIVVFVHGFNNNLAEGVYRTAQLAHDFELPGVAVHFSWPSLANPLGYGYDRDSVLFSRDGFEALLTVLRGSGARRILVVAHSVGGLLTMETLRQMSPSQPARQAVQGVILLSPDIDVEVFRAQAARIGDLPQPFVIFVSRRDRALRLSARLTGQKERLGTLQDQGEVADLEVTLFDVTEFSKGPGANHFVAGNSPALIQLFNRLPEMEAAFQRDRAGRTGLLPGTILTVQNATQIILRQPP